MPKLTIQKNSGLDAASAFAKVKSFLNDDKDLKKLDPSYKCTFDDKKLSGSADGKMFKANMAVSASKSGSQVEIVVELPLALTLVKGMVEKTLHKKLDETLA